MSNWTGFAVSAVVSFLLAPFVVNSLGNTHYGVWVLLGSLVGYLGLLDLGIRGAVTRYVAHLHAAGRDQEASRITSAALALFMGAGAIAALLSLALAWLAPRLFQIPAELVPVARTVFVLGGLTIAITLVGGVFGGIIVGLQRFDWLNGVGIAATLLRAGLVVAALKVGAGLVGLAVVQLSASVLIGVVHLLLSRRAYPALTIRVTHWTREDIARVFAFGAYASLLHISMALITYADSLVIGAFRPVGAITFFAIAASLTDYARQVVSGISQTVTPLASARQAASTTADLRRILLKASRLATLVVLPIIVTFLVRGSSFIGLWMGPAYGGPSGAVLVVLSLALWPFAAYQVLSATAIGLNAHRGLVPAFLTEAVCNIGLSVALVARFGVVGVAWGTAIPRLAVCLFFGPWYARRIVQVGFMPYWMQSWVLPWIGMVPFLAGSLLVERMWPAPNLAVFFLQVACTLPLAAIGAWSLALTAEERREWSDTGRRLLGGVLRRSQTTLRVGGAGAGTRRTSLLGRFRPGRWVQVRPAEDILATLDADGTLDGLPFMREMLAYCGRRLRVHKVAHKTCDTIGRTGGRRMRDAVHLEGVRCDGSAHGGCQAACLVFWKTAWLAPVDGPPDRPAAAAPAAAPENIGRLPVTATPGPDAAEAEVRYVCQATELVRATKPLKWWDGRQYVRDLWSGNVGIGEFARVVATAAFNAVQRRRGGRQYPVLTGSSPAGSPAASVHPTPGQLVRIKSRQAIAATLDAGGRNQGLWFDAEMVPYCGGTYRVAQRVERIIDEKTGKMLRLPRDCWILEGVTCRGHLSPGRLLCPRGIYSYWREVWLEEAEPASVPGAKL